MSCRRRSRSWWWCWEAMERCWRRPAPLPGPMSPFSVSTSAHLAFSPRSGWLTCTPRLRAGGRLLHYRCPRHAAYRSHARRRFYKEYEALNDVVVAKGAIARMGDFSIHLFDQLAASFRADGVIISTPTGSTAYNLAANGPILAPDVDALVITPVCPHLLTLRPMVVRGDAQVTVSIEGVPDLTFLTVDGQEAFQLEVGDQVRCRRSEHSVKLVRLGATGFFDVLRSKLSGASAEDRRRHP